MEIVVKIAQFILSLSILIIIHELGHFMFARIFKVRVEKFYLFFDPWFSLFKFKKGDTEYGLGWIPFGGYVKISGMIDESMDLEQMKLPPKPYEFRSKPAWQRLLIMIGGVLMNIILAVCIYIGMSYVWGDKYLANDDVKYGYVFNDLGREIGFQSGDKIIDVEGQKVENSGRIPLEIAINQATYVTVERDGVRKRIDIPEEYIAGLLKSQQELMTPRIPFVIASVMEGGGAMQAGLQAGDTLVSFNGEPMRFFDEFQHAFALNKDQTVQIGIVRDSAGIAKVMTLPVNISQDAVIGVHVDTYDKFLPLSVRNYTLLQAIPQGFKRVGTETSAYWKQMKLIFTPKTEAYKSVGSIIAIGNMFPGYWNWQVFWSFTAILSIALAVINILPIPALDGGHVVFLLYEVITGRKPNEKFMEYTTLVGIILVFGLMILLTGNDIYKIFIK